MADLHGVPGELRLTITVKRASTGEEETFELVGRVLPNEPEVSEPHDEPHPLDGGA